jgi:hypothetical protein
MTSSGDRYRPTVLSVLSTRWSVLGSVRWTGWLSTHQEAAAAPRSLSELEKPPIRANSGDSSQQTPIGSRWGSGRQARGWRSLRSQSRARPAQRGSPCSKVETSVHLSLNNRWARMETSLRLLAAHNLLNMDRISR